MWNASQLRKDSSTENRADKGKKKTGERRLASEFPLDAPWAALLPGYLNLLLVSGGSVNEKLHREWHPVA